MVGSFGAKTMMFIIKLKITQAVRKVVHSKQFYGILMLTIGVSWTWAITFSFYEGADIMRFVRTSVADFVRPTEIVIINNRVIETAYAAEAESVQEKISVPEESYQIATIKRISKEEKIDWKLVYAVCLKESGCNPKLDCENQYGRCDNGLSFGAYQIYNPTLDPERKRMAEDFEEATRWTIKHGYRFKDDPATFFKNHNGLYKTTNQWYVDGAMEKYNSL
jgi:hypothetical protein